MIQKECIIGGISNFSNQFYDYWLKWNPKITKSSLCYTKQLYGLNKGKKIKLPTDGTLFQASISDLKIITNLLNSNQVVETFELQTINIQEISEMIKENKVFLYKNRENEIVGLACLGTEQPNIYIQILIVFSPPKYNDKNFVISILNALSYLYCIQKNYQFIYIHTSDEIPIAIKSNLLDAGFMNKG